MLSDSAAIILRAVCWSPYTEGEAAGFLLLGVKQWQICSPKQNETFTWKLFFSPLLWLSISRALWLSRGVWERGGLEQREEQVRRSSVSPLWHHFWDDQKVTNKACMHSCPEELQRPDCSRRDPSVPRWYTAATSPSPSLMLQQPAKHSAVLRSFQQPWGCLLGSHCSLNNLGSSDGWGVQL